MTIAEIYKLCDDIGCLNFSTWNGREIVSRIAHFFAHDDEGIYLRTMNTKPFYTQLKEHGLLSISGMYPKTQVSHDQKGLPYFVPGYAIRFSGEVRELDITQVEQKAKINDNFVVAMHDIEKYPATKVFVLHKAHGDVFDYDFELSKRDHKLLRIPFAYGGAELEPLGLHITEDCISCGACMEACTFSAINQGDIYSIIGNRCDECGNCVEVCPVNAIALR